MSIKSFDQNKCYEWFGSFWFPSKTEKNEEMSGKVTYTPEHGIKLELLKDFADIDIAMKPVSKKILHGIVQGEKPISLTIVNVHLSLGFQMGNPTCSTLKGFAAGIIANDFCEDVYFDGISLQYDDYFNNIFLDSPRKDTDAIIFSKSDAIKLNNEYEIDLDVSSFGPIILSRDQIDTVFFSEDNTVIDRIKTAIEPTFEKGASYLAKRQDVTFSVRIKRPRTEFRDFFEKEDIWRNYWELIVDHPISVKSIWLYTKDTETTKGSARYQRNPFLSSYRMPHEPKKKPEILQLLKLNFYSFGKKEKTLFHLQEHLNRWLEINSNQDWEPVIDGLKLALVKNHDFTDRTNYVSLIAEIETFLDLTGQSTTTPDTLIELYASDEWKKGFKQLHANLPREKSMGQWAAEVRNTITHPTKTKTKSGGSYRAIATDKLSLQKTYAYMAGLLTKGVLSYIGGIEAEALEKYTMQFIKSRSSFYPIEFEE